jgi:hypothetical protein
VNKAKRNLTVTLVGVATAVTVATPAHADPLTDNNFLGALTNAGIGYNDPGQHPAARTVDLPDAGRTG